MSKKPADAMEAFIKRISRMEAQIRSLTPVIQGMSAAVSKEAEALGYRMKQMNALRNEICEMHAHLRVDAESMKTMLQGLGGIPKDKTRTWMMEVRALLITLNSSFSESDANVIVCELTPEEQVDLSNLINTSTYLLQFFSDSPVNKGSMGKTKGQSEVIEPPQESQVKPQESVGPSRLQGRTPKGTKMPKAIKTAQKAE